MAKTKAKRKKKYKIPFTPKGNLVTYPNTYGAQYEVAGGERGVDHKDLVWVEPEKAGFQGVCTYVCSYTGRSRARIVLKRSNGGHVEILQGTFDSIMSKTKGLNGKKTVKLPWVFVKKGANYLCDVDWDAV
jgi:hypothetical protein